jgi:hypothetical protein
MNNLAYFYSKLGLIDHAITLLQKALDGRQRNLGSEHQDTRWSKEILDSCLGLPIIGTKLTYRITRELYNSAAAPVIPPDGMVDQDQIL